MSNARTQGLLIAVLGPDGSGKSSLLEALIPWLASTGNAVQMFHLRPGVGRRRDGEVQVVTDPHGRAARGPVSSLAKLAYYVIDYSVGYVLKVRPALRRGEIVLFDRYYDDLIVDPRRYRYGGPLRAVRLARSLVPRPDLLLVLDAPALVLQARKPEVTFAESERQRTAYRALADSVPYGRLVNANQPLEVVVEDVQRLIQRSATK